MYNDERATDAKTRSKQAVAVGEGSDDLIWCTQKGNNAKKTRAGMHRFSSGARRAGGPADPDRRYKSYFCILQDPEPAEYKSDLGISGCGGNRTNSHFESQFGKFSPANFKKGGRLFFRLSLLPLILLPAFRIAYFILFANVPWRLFIIPMINTHKIFPSSSQ